MLNLNYRNDMFLNIKDSRGRNGAYIMRKVKHDIRGLQELYLDGEAEFIDERYVSPDMLKGINDCINYLEDKYTRYNEYAKYKNMVEV